MKQLINSRLVVNAGGGTRHFSPFIANDAVTLSAGEGAHIVSAAGTLRNLRVYSVTGGLGVGGTSTCSLYVNGSLSALTGQLTSAVTSFTDTSTVSVSAGDTVEFRITTNVAAGAHTIQASLEFEASATDTTVYGYGGAGSVLGTPPTNNGLLFHGGSGSWLSDANLIGGDVATTAGTITAHYVRVDTAPSAGKSRTFTIYKNGTAQDGTGGTPDTRVTISDAATTGSATFSLSVAANDALWVRHTATGSPSNTHRGTGMVTFVSTAASHAMYGGSTNTNPHSVNTTFNPPGGFETIGFSTTEADHEFQNGPTPFTVDALRVDVSIAPGVGKSWVFTLRKNGSDTALAATISGTATSGSSGTLDPGVEIGDGDLYALKSVPSGTPAAPSGVRFSFVALENAAPTVYAGPNQSGAINEVFSLDDATATDDGIPGTGLTYTWTQQSGPGTAIWGVAEGDELHPWVVFPVSGVYVLRLTVSDGALSAYDECQITVSGTVVQGPSICGTRAHFTWVETNYQVN